MAYINGKQVNFSSYILDENGYYTKNEIKDQINYAESERQKSKNLFNMSSAQLSGTATISINGNTLTVSNNGDYGYVGFTVNVKPNTTYTLSRLLNIVTSGNENTGDIGIYLSNEVVSFKAGSSENYITFTTGDETEITIYFYVVPYGSIGTGSVEFSNVQLEEGSVVTDYQPYNGAIVHEKDILDVEHVETIYDNVSQPTPLGTETAYSSGLEVAQGNGYRYYIPFSDYDRLEIVARAPNQNQIHAFLDLTNNYNVDSSYSGRVCVIIDGGDAIEFVYTVPTTKDSIYLAGIGSTLNVVTIRGVKYGNSN